MLRSGRTNEEEIKHRTISNCDVKVSAMLSLVSVTFLRYVPVSSQAVIADDRHDVVKTSKRQFIAFCEDVLAKRDRTTVSIGQLAADC